jgi:mRNA interferase MazF
LKNPKASIGNEQRGKRYAVIIQSDSLMISTTLVAPTSTSATPAVFRPEITLLGQRTCVQVEQATAVAPSQLGKLVGHATLREMQDIEAALHLVLNL